MKKFFAYVAILISAYLGFIVATLPAKFVVNQLTLPTNISLHGVSGTIWHTKVEQLVVTNTPIHHVEAKLSFWSLLTLTPSVEASFGGAMQPGPEGKLKIAVSNDDITLTHVDALVSANTIAQQISLPLPVTAKGNVELKLAKLSLALSHEMICLQAQGDIHWLRAGVIALEQNVKLGKLSASLACEQEALAVNLSSKNDLGLSFSAYVRGKGNISGQGYLQPGNRFPAELKSSLSFLGNPDSQGRYRLSL